MAHYYESYFVLFDSLKSFEIAFLFLMSNFDDSGLTGHAIFDRTVRSEFIYL